VTISPEGKITDVNEGTIKATGVLRENLIGTDFCDYFTEPDKAREGYQQVFAKGYVTDYPLTIRNRDGRLIDVLYNASLYKDARGNVLGVFAAARDVTSQKAASQYARSLIEASPDPLVTISPEGKITDVNEGTIKATGVLRENLIGTDFCDYFTEPDKAREGYQQVLAKGYVTDYPLTIRNRDGRLIDVLYNASLYKDARGGVLGVFAVARDVTAQKRAESAIAEQQSKELERITELERFQKQYARSLIEASPDPLVTISPEGKITDVNEGTIKATGVLRENLIGTDFCDYFTEPDKAREGYQQVFTRGIVTDYPLTVRHIDRHLTEVLYSASLYKDVHGGVLGVFAAARDVTAQKEAEAELKIRTDDLAHHARQMTLLNDFSGVLRATVSTSEAYSVIAKFAQQLLPQESGALCVRNSTKKMVETVAVWGDASPTLGEFTPDDCWAFRRSRLHRVDDAQSVTMCAHLASPLPVGYLCVPIVAWGNTLGILHFYSRIMPLSGEKELLIGVMTEHVALALFNLQLQEKLRWQADRDSLTGLFNRRHMDKVLAQELGRAAKQSSPLCLAMLDLDHFKEFNDTHGHLAGDALLQQIGALLQDRIRGRDIVCRYGGEEFIVIMPDVSWNDSARRVRQLQNEIKQLRVLHEGHSLGAVSVSVGVSIFPEHGMNAQELVLAADQALYRAKAEGRDRIIVANGKEEDALHPTPHPKRAGPQYSDTKGAVP